MKKSNFNQIIEHFSSFAPEVKGRKFEVLCKWFLENDFTYSEQIKKVWLWQEWPGNWGRDKGIDLVAETYSGELWAIQAKAYDESYYITKEDIDTFLSESSRKDFSFRLLISTTNNIGPNSREVLLAQEKRVGLCLRDNLELSDLDWSLILKNSGEKFKQDPKIPRKHQEAAINAVMKGFEQSSYGQIYMACGTGKSLIGLWLAAKLNAKNILVLVPSISLVAQLYKEWSSNAGDFTFDPIFVCSDPTVSKANDDCMSFDSIDLGFPVTTNVDEILTQYFRNTSRSKIIFATYHSSPIIAQACSQEFSFGFDLAIADEAHRCAGATTSDLATIVDKSAIRTKHKLFMTATPKIFSNHVKQKTQEIAYEIVSMDDEEKFGPIFYKLPFSDAIKKGLLSDYQVLISVMDNATYRGYAERGRFVSFENHEIDARTLASQLLIAKAIKKFDLKKVISFHSRTKAAKDFIKTLPKALPLLLESEKPVIAYQAILFGDMPQSERHKILKQLDETSDGAALVANVKCLSEGVDVPSLDGIVFVEPKGSEIDIIQAVGRAIRKSSDKTLGTIIIPLFVDGMLDENLALDQSCFRSIGKVLRSLRAHDDIIAKELDSIRLELGKKVYTRPSRSSKIFFDISIELSSDFSETLKLKILENIVEQCSSEWNYQFELLREFYRLNNRWPAQHEEFPIENKLGMWCSYQRTLYKKKFLRNEQIKVLDSIGFVWDLLSAVWEENFLLLNSFKKVNGHCNVPAIYFENQTLATWVSVQRRAFKKGLLSLMQLEKLNSIGFVWDILSAVWEENFLLLNSFKEANGHCNVPARYLENQILATWICTQRYDYKKHRMSQDRINKLNSIGFIWDLIDKSWENSFFKLCKFKEINGHCNVPKRYANDPSLARWVMTQRKSYKDGKLSEKRIKKLNEICFQWYQKRGISNI